MKEEMTSIKEEMAPMKNKLHYQNSNDCNENAATSTNTNTNKVDIDSVNYSRGFSGGVIVGSTIIGAIFLSFFKNSREK